MIDLKFSTLTKYKFYIPKKKHLTHIRIYLLDYTITNCKQNERKKKRNFKRIKQNNWVHWSTSFDVTRWWDGWRTNNYFLTWNAASDVGAGGLRLWCIRGCDGNWPFWIASINHINSRLYCCGWRKFIARAGFKGGLKCNGPIGEGFLGKIGECGDREIGVDGDPLSSL